MGKLDGEALGDVGWLDGVPVGLTVVGLTVGWVGSVVGGGVGLRDIDGATVGRAVVGRAVGFAVGGRPNFSMR